MESDSGQDSGEIGRLPPEILMHIFSFISRTELHSTVAKVCQHWNELHNDETFYRVLKFTLSDKLTYMRHCMRHAKCLKSFTLKADNALLSGVVSKRGREIADGAFGEKLRTFSFGLLNGYDLTKREEELVKLYISSVLFKCLNLHTLCLIGLKSSSTPTFLFARISICPSIQHLCSNLRVLHLLNLKMIGDYSEKNLVIRCELLEELQFCNKRTTSLRPDYYYGDIMYFTGEEFKGLCERLSGSLRVLHVNYGDLHFKDLKFLAKCHRLEDLGLYNAIRLTGEGLRVIGQLPGLRKLTVKDCHLPDDESWSRMLSSPELKSLEFLNLTFCSIDETAVLAIGSNLNNLHSLRMWKVNQISHVGTAFNELIMCHSLRELHLIGMGDITLTSDVFRGICERLSGSLVCCNLNYGDLHFEDLKFLAECHHLEQLGFSNASKLSAEGLSVIGQLKGLEDLRIKDCILPDEDSWARMIFSPELKSLGILFLERCNIDKTTVFAIGSNLKNLRVLNLARYHTEKINHYSNFDTEFKKLISNCRGLQELVIIDVGVISKSKVLLIPRFLPSLDTFWLKPTLCYSSTWLENALKSEMPALGHSQYGIWRNNNTLTCN